MTIEEKLAALLDEDERQNPTNRLALHGLINDHRRKRSYERHKALRAHLKLAAHVPADAAEKFVAEMRKPITAEEMDRGGMDELLTMLQEMLDSGDLEEIIYALGRIARKAHAWNPHLGPIEGLPKETPKT